MPATNRAYGMPNAIETGASPSTATIAQPGVERRSIPARLIGLLPISRLCRSAARCRLLAVFFFASM
jgi:hypothetical protein